MTTKQEPKYTIVDGKLVNRQSGAAIPDDEPLFILRAKDRHAVAALREYLEAIEYCGPEHREAVTRRLYQFERFREQHSERVTTPNTNLTSDWDNLCEPE